MGILDRLLFWRKPAEATYEITDCFGEPNSVVPSGPASFTKPVGGDEVYESIFPEDE